MKRGLYVFNVSCSYIAKTLQTTFYLTKCPTHSVIFKDNKYIYELELLLCLASAEFFQAEK